MKEMIEKKGDTGQLSVIKCYPQPWLLDLSEHSSLLSGQRITMSKSNDWNRPPG